MPTKHLILPDLDLLYLEYSGVVTIQDQAVLMTGALSDPMHRLGMPILSHSRDLIDTELDFPSLMRLREPLALTYAGTPGPIYCALLAQGDLAYGMARMVQALLVEIEAFEVEVFRESQPALTYLGLDGTDAADRLNLDGADAVNSV